MKLVLNAPDSSNAALEIAAELEQAILSDPSRNVEAVHPHERLSEKAFSLWSRLEGLLPQCMLRVISMVRLKLLRANRHYFNVLMTPNWRKCFPHILYPGHKSVYLFDAWPGFHEGIVNTVKSHHLSRVFVSSSQAAKRLQGMIDRPVFSWVPEGIDPERYQFRSYEDKDIDVLELGRKYDAYHDRIVSAMESDGRTHLYEKTKGVLIFPTSEDLIDGLARTRISICVPSNITHPERSGDIETMTVRYLQSMVSKCLIVGHAPQEMVELFGYNPVIEIDMGDPVGQLRSILDHFDDHVALIEKNYQEAISKHTWKNRWEQIAKIIEA
ncbi:MAG: hypothetical protein ACPIG6_10465 [Akkermansiaceae bacterium]